MCIRDRAEGGASAVPRGPGALRAQRDQQVRRQVRQADRRTDRHALRGAGESRNNASCPRPACPQPA
eukprot:6625326-Prorocentrum_lima.AAC.1